MAHVNSNEQTIPENVNSSSRGLFSGFVDAASALFHVVVDESDDEEYDVEFTHKSHGNARSTSTSLNVSSTTLPANNTTSEQKESGRNIEDTINLNDDNHSTQDTMRNDAVQNAPIQQLDEKNQFSTENVHSQKSVSNHQIQSQFATDQIQQHAPSLSYTNQVQQQTPTFSENSENQLQQQSSTDQLQSDQLQQRDQTIHPSPSVDRQQQEQQQQEQEVQQQQEKQEKQQQEQHQQQQEQQQQEQQLQEQQLQEQQEQQQQEQQEQHQQEQQQQQQQEQQHSNVMSSASSLSYTQATSQSKEIQPKFSSSSSQTNDYSTSNNQRQMRNQSMFSSHQPNDIPESATNRSTTLSHLLNLYAPVKKTNECTEPAYKSSISLPGRPDTSTAIRVVKKSSDAPDAFSYGGKMITQDRSMLNIGSDTGDQMSHRILEQLNEDESLNFVTHHRSPQIASTYLHSSVYSAPRHNQSTSKSVVDADKNLNDPITTQLNQRTHSAPPSPTMLAKRSMFQPRSPFKIRGLSRTHTSTQVVSPRSAHSDSLSDSMRHLNTNQSFSTTNAINGTLHPEGDTNVSSDKSRRKELSVRRSSNSSDVLYSPPRRKVDRISELSSTRSAVSPHTRRNSTGISSHQVLDTGMSHRLKDEKSIDELAMKETNDSARTRASSLLDVAFQTHKTPTKVDNNPRNSKTSTTSSQVLQVPPHSPPKRLMRQISTSSEKDTVSDDNACSRSNTSMSSGQKMFDASAVENISMIESTPSESFMSSKFTINEPISSTYATQTPKSTNKETMEQTVPSIPTSMPMNQSDTSMPVNHSDTSMPINQSDASMSIRLKEASQAYQTLMNAFTRLQAEHRASLEREENTIRVLHLRDEKLQQYSELLDHHHQSNNQISDLTMRNDALKHQVDQLKQELNSSLQELQQLRATSSQFNVSTSSFQSQIDSLRTQLNTVQGERDLLSSRVRVLEQQSDVLSEDLAKTTKARDKLQSLLESMPNHDMQEKDQSNNSNLNDEIEKLHNALQLREQERNDARQQCDSLTEQLHKTKLQETSQTELSTDSSSNIQNYKQLAHERGLKLARLQETVRELEQKQKESNAESENNHSSLVEDYSVDKRVIAQLVTAYFAGSASEGHTLRTLASMLDMSDHQKRTLGLLPPLLPSFDRSVVNLNTTETTDDVPSGNARWNSLFQSSNSSSTTHTSSTESTVSTSSTTTQPPVQTTSATIDSMDTTDTTNSYSATKAVQGAAGLFDAWLSFLQHESVDQEGNPSTK